MLLFRDNSYLEDKNNLNTEYQKVTCKNGIKKLNC